MVEPNSKLDREIKLNENKYQIKPPSNLKLLSDIFELSPNTAKWTFQEFVTALEGRIGWFEMMRDPIKTNNRKRQNFRIFKGKRQRLVKKEAMQFHEIIPKRKIDITKQVAKRTTITVGQKVNPRREFIALLAELWLEMGGGLTAKSYYDHHPKEDVKDKVEKKEFATPATQFINNIVQYYNIGKPSKKKKPNERGTKIKLQSNEGLRWEIRNLLKRSKYQDSKN